jgi:hypothetical protein
VKFEYWPSVLDRALNYFYVGLAALAFSLFWWWRTGRATAKAMAVETVQPELAAAS